MSQKQNDSQTFSCENCRFKPCENRKFMATPIICTNEPMENELADLIKFFKTIIAIEHNNFRDSFLLNVRFSWR